MVNVILILIIAFFAFFGVRAIVKRLKGESGCCGTGPSTIKIQTKDKKKANYKYKTTLSVDGMKCKNCADRVQNALNEVDGVYVLKVSLSKGKVSLLVKEGVSDEDIKAAVEKAGYRAGEITME